jgi:lysylphosphatidylglycerol synthetase-like protein (DUF2156 family)
VERFGDGDLIACAALQPGLEYVETSFGAWAYRRVGDVSAALGGPWCAPGDRAEMLRRFLRASRKPLMFYLRGPFAETCARAGLHTASMGQDRVLDTAALLREPPKEVRGALRHAARHDFTLREVSLSGLDAALRAQLDTISRDAIGRADVGREITFLNRPWSSVDDGARRVFLLGQGDSILGFAVINAIWREGVGGAWLLDLLRFRETRQWGVWWSVVHALSARLAAEGTSLAVGFAPLHRLAHGRPPVRPSAHRGLPQRLDSAMTTGPMPLRATWCAPPIDTCRRRRTLRALRRPRGRPHPSGATGVLHLEHVMSNRQLGLTLLLAVATA